MYLRFNVESQHLTRTDRSIVVARSENYLKAKFDFSPDWDGVTKTGVFTNGGRVYNVILDNDECFVPTEVIRKGCFTVSVFGGDLITADVVTIRVEPSGYEIGGSPEPPTPEVYEQVIGMFDKFRGGEEGQVLSKSSDEDLEFEWVNQGGGGGGTAPRWGNITGTLSTQADLQAALDAKENAADAFDGNYENLTNKPALFSGDYRDLTNKPELFSGNYEDLTNKPEVPTITANPTLSGTEAQLEGLEIDGIKYAVPSGGGSGTTVVANPTLVGTEPTLNGIGIGGDKLAVFNENRIIGSASVVADSTTRTASTVTVTKIDDFTYEVATESTSFVGASRKYNLSEIGTDGVTFETKFERATGDVGNAITFQVYVNGTGGLVKVQNITLAQGVESVRYIFSFTNAFIQDNKSGTKFDLQITATAARDIKETVILKKGITTAEASFQTLRNKTYAPLVGKKVMFLGDSITALNNERSWVNAFCTITGAQKLVDVAVDGAYLADKENTVYDGDPKYSVSENNVLGNQVQKIINNEYEAPDIIIISIGTNGGISADDATIIASYYSGGTVVALADVNRKTTEGAFRYCNETLHSLYPNALIFWCSPIQSRNNHHHIDDFVGYSDALKKLTAYGSAYFVDTMRCGIHMANETSSGGEYTVDGLHPNAKGAMRMARYNADAICSMASIASRYKDTWE